MLRVESIPFAEASLYVEIKHRHHDPAQGHKFSLQALDGERLCGVVIVGRPVARHLNQRSEVEVTRMCADGTRNACSLLYGAARRAAFALGYRRIITYILDSESGTSLRASGWRYVYSTSGGARGIETADRGKTKRRQGRNSSGNRGTLTS